MSKKAERMAVEKNPILISFILSDTKRDSAGSAVARMCIKPCDALKGKSVSMVFFTVFILFPFYDACEYIHVSCANQVC